MKKTILIAVVVALTTGCSNNSNKAAETKVGADSSTATQNIVDDQNGSDVNSLRAQNIEKASMELMKHPVVLEAKAKGLKSLQEGELSKKPDGIRYAQSAIDEEAVLACTYGSIFFGIHPSCITRKLSCH